VTGVEIPLLVFVAIRHRAALRRWLSWHMPGSHQLLPVPAPVPVVV
jgi:hypothetical protein